jgi:CDP-glucose 4,6-dehydratase
MAISRVTYPDPKFWNGRRVLVTGHTGFKGSWLCLWLQALGADVYGFALDPATDPNLFELAHIADGMTSMIGDIRDPDALERAVGEAKPEIVVHLAAQPLVRESYLNPVETYATNVMGLVHLLEATRRLSQIRVLINVTTDKCYENQEWPWGYRESDPMGGYDPYSSSKGCSELVTQAYRRSFFKDGVAVATARAGNVIGGGDWARDRLIPDILDAFAGGSPAVIRYPDAIRPWQHVLEPLSGYLLLSQRLFADGAAVAGGWNFGPEDRDCKPVRYVADRLIKLWGDDASWTHDGEEHPHEAGFLKLDCSKAAYCLDWRPRWHLERALEAVIDWHKGYLDGEDLAQLSHRQITEFNTTEAS